MDDPGKAMNFLFSDAVLMRSLLLFLMLGSVVGLCAGTALLLNPDWLMRMSKHANRWVSTRQMGRPLDKPINMEHWFYRYSYLSGGALLAGAIYIIYMFTAPLARTNLMLSLSKMHLVQTVLLEPLLDTLVLVFISGAVLALVVSLFLLFRPSMLREFEFGANQNISLRQSLKPMEIQRGNVDQLVFRHVRIVGMVILCGSLYTFVVLVFWLLK
jgi:hypothetical protein